MDLEKRIELLEKRMAELEGQVQEQPKQLNKTDFVKSAKANMPSYIDTSEGANIDIIVKAITDGLAQALKAL